MTAKIISMQSKEIMAKYIEPEAFCYYPNWKYRDLNDSILMTIAPYELESIRSSLQSNVSIGIQDGVFDFANSFYNPFFKDKQYKLHFPCINNIVLCFGKNEANFIKSLNGNKVLVTTYIPQYIKNTIVAANDFSNRNASFDVMITTANTAYFSDQEFDTLVSYLRIATETLLAGGYKVCFRIFDDKIVASLGFDNISNIKYGKFLDAASNARCIFTTPSTLAVESMILGIPTATFVYRDTPLTTQTGWLIYDPSLSLQITKSMLSKDPERFAMQQALVENYLSPDIEHLDEATINNLVGGIDIQKDTRSSLAQSVLLSKWNFNPKFILKRIIHKFRW